MSTEQNQNKSKAPSLIGRLAAYAQVGLIMVFSVYLLWAFLGGIDAQYLVCMNKGLASQYANLLKLARSAADAGCAVAVVLAENELDVDVSCFTNTRTVSENHHSVLGFGVAGGNKALVILNFNNADSATKAFSPVENSLSCASEPLRRLTASVSVPANCPPSIRTRQRWSPVRTRPVSYRCCRSNRRRRSRPRPRRRPPQEDPCGSS